MGKAARNYLLDVVLALLALLLAMSSFLLWIVFPRGYSPARRMWVDIHKWGGLALGVAVLVHVRLHRRWLIRMTRRYLLYLQKTAGTTLQRRLDLVQSGKARSQ